MTSESEAYTVLQVPARNIAAPKGWRRADQYDPFEAWLGPYFERAEGGALDYAFLVDNRHVDETGSTHDGALMTFADACFGYAIWSATNRSPCVTVSQQSSFLAPARIGDLVVCRPQLVRITRDMAFVRGDFMVRGDTMCSVSAVWRIWRRN